MNALYVVMIKSPDSRVQGICEIEVDQREIIRYTGNRKKRRALPENSRDAKCRGVP